MKNITGFAHEVVSLAFTQDGKILATGGGSPTEDGEVKFFEVGTWKQIGEIKAGHSDTVYGLCFQSRKHGNHQRQKGKDQARPDDRHLLGGQVHQGLGSAERQVRQVLRRAHPSRSRRRLDAGRQIAGQRRRRQHVKVWDFEKGETGPAPSRATPSRSRA